MKCKACEGTLKDSIAGRYTFCPSCGSANYVSDRNAGEDNKDYFNSVYSDKVYSTVIGNRLRLFEKFERVHTLMHGGESRRFSLLLEKISELICHVEKTIESGVGNGDELIKYLKTGANIYGYDLSTEALRNFQLKYPEFADRVDTGNINQSCADIIYSNALFEHLDNPGDFIRSAHGMLNLRGRLIIRMPIITGKFKAIDEAERDINFWKPCHRVLYTFKGLVVLLEKNGFKIQKSATFAYYGYKVMSRMLKLGYTEISYTRNPYFALKGLTDSVFKKILLQSLFDNVVCSDFALIAEKI